LEQADDEFAGGRMKPSAHYDRIVDVITSPNDAARRVVRDCLAPPVAHNERRNITKGQKAMAWAMRYPNPEKGDEERNSPKPGRV
jgi:hypothetical protein